QIHDGNDDHRHAQQDAGKVDHKHGDVGSHPEVVAVVPGVGKRAVGQGGHQPDDQTLNDHIQDLLPHFRQLADEGIDHQVLVLPGGNDGAQVDQVNEADAGDLLRLSEADAELAQHHVQEGE